MPTNNIMVPVPRTSGRSPVDAYFLRLAKKSSRRTIASALRRVSGVFTGEEQDIDTFSWESLRRMHVKAIRAALVYRVDAGEISVATANKYLSATRGVLKECWRLSLIDTCEYHKAVDVPQIQGKSPEK